MDVDETQLSDALDGDADAVTAILGTFAKLIRRRARRIDWRNTEDIEQVGRESLWRCLRTFTGTTVAEFVAYADRSITGDMMGAHCDMRYPGISLDSSEV